MRTTDAVEAEFELGNERHSQHGQDVRSLFGTYASRPAVAVDELSLSGQPTVSSVCKSFCEVFLPLDCIDDQAAHSTHSRVLWKPSHAAYRNCARCWIRCRGFGADQGGENRVILHESQEPPSQT
jgi:hypothetical protein